MIHLPLSFWKRSKIRGITWATSVLQKTKAVPKWKRSQQLRPRRRCRSKRLLQLSTFENQVSSQEAKRCSCTQSTMNTWNQRRAHFMRRWIRFSNIRNNRNLLMQLISPYTKMEKTKSWQKKVWKTSKSNLLHLNQNLISRHNGTTKLCLQPSQKDSMISELESSIRSMKTRSTRAVVQSMPAAA